MVLGASVGGFDPYFMYAYNSYNPYNPSFQGSTTTKTQQSTATNTTTDTSTQNLPKKDYSESSNTGLLVGGLAIAGGAAALIYGAKKGKFGAVKKFFGFGGKEASKVVNEAKNSVTEQFTARYNKAGDLVFTIPGKTTKVTGMAGVRNFASKHNINIDDLMKFSPDNSTLKGGKFTYKDGSDVYTLAFKDGALTDIHKGGRSLKAMLDSSNVDDIKLVDKFNKELNKIQSFEKGWEKKLTDVEYTTQIGDDILTLTLPNFSRNPVPTKIELATLKRFSKDADAVKAFIHDNDSAAVFLSDTLKEGKLPDSLKIKAFDAKFDANRVCHFGEDGVLTGITINNKYYGPSTDKFKAFEYDEKNTIKTLVENLLKDNKIPDGALIVAK